MTILDQLAEHAGERVSEAKAAGIIHAKRQLCF